MHWLGYNDAVSSLNEAKTRIFQPTANFEIFKIYLYFVCQPAIRPGCTRYRAPEISHDKGNGSGFTKMLFRRRFTQENPRNEIGIQCKYPRDSVTPVTT